MIKINKYAWDGESTLLETISVHSSNDMLIYMVIFVKNKKQKQSINYADHDNLIVPRELDNEGNFCKQGNECGLHYFGNGYWNLALKNLHGVHYSINTVNSACQSKSLA